MITKIGHKRGHIERTVDLNGYPCYRIYTGCKRFDDYYIENNYYDALRTSIELIVDFTGKDYGHN